MDGPEQHNEPDPPRSDPTTTDVLVVASASGMYRISSAGTTVYFVDLSPGRRRVVRVRGAGSGVFAFDDEWLTLVHVESFNLTSRRLDPGTIRVGERPRYTFDPGPSWPDYEWRWQRVVEAIVLLDDGDAQAVRAQYRSALQPPDDTTEEHE